MAKESKSKKQARPANRKPTKKLVGSSGKGIEKRKHAHGEAAASSSGKEGSGLRKHKLLQKLQAGASQAPKSAREKKRAKRSSQSAVLGAVGGMAASLEELMAASDARMRGSSSTHAQDGGISLTSKKRQQLVVEETQHLQAVLEHPAFVADPFAALQEHLQNTVTPPVDEREGDGSKKKKGGKKG